MSNGEEMPDRDEHTLHNASRHDDVLLPDWTSDGHVDEGTIHAWLDDAFETSHAEAIQLHVTGCAMCQAAVAEARGFIAGASRISKLLDAVPAGVVSSEDVARTASRILASANVPVRAETPVALPDATRVASSLPGVRPSRWFSRNVYRVAATALVFVGGAYVWSRTPAPSVADFAPVADSTVTGAASEIAPNTQAPRVAAPAMSPPAPVAAGASTPAKSEDIAREQLAKRAGTDAATLRDQGGARADVADNTNRASSEMTATRRTPVPRSARASDTATASAAKAIAARPPESTPVPLSASGVAAAAASPPPLAERQMAANGMTANTTVTTIVGRVTTAEGRGIAEAAIAYQGPNPPGAPPQALTRSDSTGRFTLKIASDSVDIRVRRLGFAPTTTRLRLDGRDSVNVTIPLRAEVNQLAAVVVAPPPPLSLAQCLAYQPGSEPLSNMPPRFVRMEALPGSASASAIRQGTWQGTFSSSRTARVRMLQDVDNAFSGTLGDNANGQSRTMRITLSPGERAWTGEATMTVNGDVTVFPVRYTTVPLTMCKF